MKKIILIVVLLFNLSFLKISSAFIIYNEDNTNNIYLTFDDGYSLKNTTKIFEICEENKVPVTFFFHGEFLTNCPLIVNKIAKSQYALIGSHTMNHIDIRKLSLNELKKDIKTYEQMYLQITNQDMLKLFRPPMGFITKEQVKFLESLGYTIFKWNVSYYDFNPNDDRGYAYALNELKKQTKAGSIILMHTMTTSNVDVLSEFITFARNNNFNFNSLLDIKKSH